jgi:hypothetical protein
MIKLLSREIYHKLLTITLYPRNKLELENK